MKFTHCFLILMILVCLVSFTGCIPVVPEEPEVPVRILSAEVYGLVWNDEGNVCCYIENTGKVDIRFYELTFDVDLLYHKPIAPFVVLGENLDVGDIVKECIIGECPLCGEHDIVSVNVTYKLWE
jgi:hypothetical protein